MGARSIVMSVSVCLCVRLSIRDHVSETTRPIFTKFLVHVTYVCGSVLLWRRSDMLHISGFVDDVIFADKLIGCSMSPPGWGNEGHTQSSAWRVGIPVAGSRRSGLLLAVRAYTRPQWACWIFMTPCLHNAHNIPAYIATRKWRVLEVTSQVAAPGGGVCGLWLPCIWS